MPDERFASAAEAVVRGLRIDALVEAAGPVCSCPSAAGRCAPPWDVQPAVLGAPPAPLSAPQQVVALLAGAVLEHLRDGRPGRALTQAGHLAGLLDVRPGGGQRPS